MPFHVYVCVDCQEHRVGVRGPAAEKEMPCSVCQRVTKVFSVEAIRDRVREPTAAVEVLVSRVRVCAECRDPRVGVLAVNITKEMACDVCHRVRKVFLVEKMPDKVRGPWGTDAAACDALAAAGADPRTKSGAALRETFTAFGFRTTDDPYQGKGFLLWRPRASPDIIQTLYVLAGDGIGVEFGRLFLTRGDSLQTGRGYSFTEGMQEILRFLETR